MRLVFQPRGLRFEGFRISSDPGRASGVHDSASGGFVTPNGTEMGDQSRLRKRLRIWIQLSAVPRQWEVGGSDDPTARNCSSFGAWQSQANLGCNCLVPPRAPSFSKPPSLLGDQKNHCGAEGHRTGHSPHCPATLPAHVPCNRQHSRPSRFRNAPAGGRQHPLHARFASPQADNFEFLGRRIRGAEL